MPWLDWVSFMIVVIQIKDIMMNQITMILLPIQPMLFTIITNTPSTAPIQQQVLLHHLAVLQVLRVVFRALQVLIRDIAPVSM